jgi:hypothetical protein
MWFDDNAKVLVMEKIEDAVHAFMRRFKAKPNVVLVNEVESTTLPEQTMHIGEHEVQIRPSSYVRKNNFWVGLDLDTTEETDNKDTNAAPLREAA